MTKNKLFFSLIYLIHFCVSGVFAAEEEDKSSRTLNTEEGLQQLSLTPLLQHATAPTSSHVKGDESGVVPGVLSIVECPRVQVQDGDFITFPQFSEEQKRYWESITFDDVCFVPPRGVPYYHREYNMTLYEPARELFDEGVFEQITTTEEACLYPEKPPTVIESFKRLPYSAAGSIWAYDTKASYLGGQSAFWSGSAVMIDSHCALTAAHCLYTHQTKGYKLVLMSDLSHEQALEERKLYVELTDDKTHIRYKALNANNEVNEGHVTLSNLNLEEPFNVDNFGDCLKNTQLQKAMLSITTKRGHTYRLQPQFFCFAALYYNLLFKKRMLWTSCFKRVDEFS